MVTTVTTQPSPDVSFHPTSAGGGCLVSTDGLVLPLKSTSLTGEALGGIARIILQQTFINSSEQPLLVTYALPLPADGAISGFQFSFAGRTIIGEVDKKQQARERFEEAISLGHVASILEQQRSNQFHQEVGNIPPGAEIVCEITIDQSLLWLEDGAWEWRFPTVLGPRYIGASGVVPDAEALQLTVTTDEISTRASLSLKIGDAILHGTTPWSPSHDIKAETIGSNCCISMADSKGVRLDRDVAIQWQVAQPEVGVRLHLARSASQKHRVDSSFGLLSIVPPQQDAQNDGLFRDLIFLIDTSGSMDGLPLLQAVQLLSAMVDSLEEGDRLEMIEFSGRPRRWQSEPVLATHDGKHQAKRWLKQLRAGGGTEMNKALEEALVSLRPQSQRQIILVTDGYIGFENQIVETILRKLPSNACFHTVGVGSSVNRSLTKPAARAGRGLEVIIDIDGDVAPGIQRILKRTCKPLITEVSIQGDVLQIAPSKLPDLFAGSPILLSACVPSTGGTIEIHGVTEAGPYKEEVTFPSVMMGEGNQAILALFGREWIEDLEMKRLISEDLDESNKAIEEVGLTFQLASRLTSWIAVDEESFVEPDANLYRQTMPHEMVHGCSIHSLGLRSVHNTFISDMASSFAGDNLFSTVPMHAKSSSLTSFALILFLLLILFMLLFGAYMVWL